MATIEKLVLFGLRSFGPQEEDKQKIKFASPLTLFLGKNGCGKTTIIEALKFACSGDVPGGSKSGQGFVNDPKLSNRASTKGQVRLSIVDAKGNKYIVIKSVQVQNRGATSSFKRLDSTLKKVNLDGTTTTISSRCVDIDTEICDILGVSKAILNNVIFCHQEDAAWPLEEPKKLKEKFDEIFGSSEYNKCADIIRKIIKDKDTDIKVQDAKVSMLKQLKDIADKKKTELSDKKEKKERFEEIIKEKQDRVSPCDNRLREICDLEINLSRLHESCTKAETLKNALVEQQKHILSNIVNEFHGSDEELGIEIKSFQTNTDRLKGSLRNFEEQKKKIESEQKETTNLIDKAQIKFGKLHADKKQHENTLQERNNTIKNAASKLNMTPPSLSNDDLISNAIKMIHTNVAQKETIHENLIAECDREETELQKQVDVSRDKIAKANHEINSKTQQISESKNKFREINSQLKDLDYSDEQLKSLSTKINVIDVDLKNWKETFDHEVVAKKIETDKQLIRKLDEEIEELEREHKVLLKNNVTEAELETLKHEIVKREAEIHKLKNKHFDNLNLIFGDDIPKPGSIKNGVDRFRQTKSGEITDVKKKINTKQRESTTVESKLRFQKDKLLSLEKELKDSEQKVSNVCQSNSFEDTSAELQKIIEKLQKDKGQLSSGKIMYEKFVSDFQKEKPCCPLCKTDFTKQEAVTNEIIRSIRSKIAGIPKALEETTEKLKIKEAQYTELLQLKPVNERISKLKDNLIPGTTSERNSFESIYERVSKELSDYNTQLNELQNSVDCCNKITGDVALIDQQQTEIDNSRRKIVDLESQIVQVPSKRSRQQIEIQLQTNKLELTNTRRNYETSQTKLKQYNDSCQQLREERSKHVEKQLQIQKAMQGKPQLQDQLEELSNKEKSLTNEIKNLKSSLEPLGLELKEIEAMKESVKITNREKIKDAQKELNESKQFLEDIKRLQRTVERFLSEGVEQMFEKTLNELTEYKKKNASLEETKKGVLDNITDVNMQLANHDGGFRNLNDNLLLREKRKEEVKLQAEVDQLKRQIGNHNYKTILEEKKKLQLEKEEYGRQISQCVGKIDMLKQEIIKSEIELKSVEYKNAHENFKKAFVRHTATKEARQNLFLFLKTLEGAVLKFHQERMNQINKIIAKLWRSIYRGNDCDYIKIKTDEITNTGLRRTYNYKVVQIKSDVEIEMRGRCSAGQKVLACLIIRMALAETFSKNCGILALDEPTTNLDRSNIHSLSAALAKVVNARQEEKNFQLLIITHDEDFLRALSRVDKVDSYWAMTSFQWVLHHLKYESLNVVIDKSNFYVGRSKGFDIPSRNINVSRNHAGLTVSTDQVLRVEDFETMNGTYVNKVRIPSKEPVELHENDEVGFGLHSESIMPAKTDEHLSNADLIFIVKRLPLNTKIEVEDNFLDKTLNSTHSAENKIRLEEEIYSLNSDTDTDCILVLDDDNSSSLLNHDALNNDKDDVCFLKPMDVEPSNKHATYVDSTLNNGIRTQDLINLLSASQDEEMCPNVNEVNETGGEFINKSVKEEIKCNYTLDDDFIVVSDDDENVHYSQLLDDREEGMNDVDDVGLNDSLFTSIKKEIEELDKVPYGTVFSHMCIDEDESSWLSDFEIEKGNLKDPQENNSAYNQTNQNISNMKPVVLISPLPKNIVNVVNKELEMKPHDTIEKINGHKPSIASDDKDLKSNKRKSIETEEALAKKLKTTFYGQPSLQTSPPTKTIENIKDIRKRKLREIATKNSTDNLKNSCVKLPAVPITNVKISNSRGKFLTEMDPKPSTSRGPVAADTSLKLGNFKPKKAIPIIPPHFNAPKRQGRNSIQTKAPIATSSRKTDKDEYSKQHIDVSNKNHRNSIPVHNVKLYQELENVILKIINWNPVWFNEYKTNPEWGLPQSVLEGLKVMVDAFSSYKEYYNVVIPQMLMELWYFFYKEIDSVADPRRKPFFGMLLEEKRIPQKYTELSYSTLLNKKATDMHLHVKEDDVVIIQYPRQEDDVTKAKLVLGYVTKITKRYLREHDHVDHNFANFLEVDPNAVINFQIIVKSSNGQGVLGKYGKIRIITSVVSTMRIFKSVYRLKDSLLQAHILKPTKELYQIPPVHKGAILSKENLNESQKKAIWEASTVCMSNSPGIYLIQGPPGTGKTTVILNIIQQILLHPNNSSRRCILVVAPSNGAVDELAMRIIRLKSKFSAVNRKLKFVRIGPKNMVHVKVQDYMLYEIAKRNLIHEVMSTMSGANKDLLQPKYKAFVDLRDLVQDNDAEDSVKAKLNTAKLEFEKVFKRVVGRSYNDQLKKQEQKLLSGAEIICTTLSSCVGMRMEEVFERKNSQNNITCCIVDEATQSNEQETLIPLILGVSKIILVGDPKQLPAVTQTKEAKDFGYGKSLFSRIMSNFPSNKINPVHILNVQYRMHPEISQFPNTTFYNGKLSDSSCVKKRKSIFNSIQPYLVFNFDMETIMNSQEYSNKAEIICVLKLLNVLNKKYKKSNKFSVGVITPYNNQKSRINDELRGKTYSSNVSVNTVDSFQGQEKDVIIMSCVRENSNNFVTDEQRLNVALTRAKHALYIIGSSSLFKPGPQTDNARTYVVGDYDQVGRYDKIEKLPSYNEVWRYDQTQSWGL
ncbi:hypothetical protein FQR65_LT10663 [Abscondita terminalis]|nr:hypothetical protein FQR65_LT10663 [Abscondita terminalis]